MTDLSLPCTEPAAQQDPLRRRDGALTPEDRVRAAASRYDDERGSLAAAALAALARRQATAGKTCARCGERLPFRAYRRDATRFDGVYPTCNRCVMRGSG